MKYIYGQQVTVWLGRKQHACMSTTQLAIWPIGTVKKVCHDLKSWTHSHHNYYSVSISILCVHAAQLTELDYS